MTEYNVTQRSFKIMLLGDSSVGKTCFIKRYTDETFQDAYLSTVGFDYSTKLVTLKDGTKIKVQIWDTAGQERFRTISKGYYKGAHGMLLIYDVTNQRSFDNIRKWIAQIKEEASSKVCIILVANKIDSKNRVISETDGENIAKSFDLKIFEASAKDNINVSEAFQELIEDINVNFEQASIYGNKLTKENINKKNGCCK